ncbi:MAG TPA: hypothetical protein VMZ90_04350, partial [Vicinamibacterales bacterium]|nr:hypothetical protein [Vicinamibacterales bacterium]
MALIAAMMLCACGGGGGAAGGSSTSISVTPTSLSFKANTQDDPKSSNVTANFNGDGLVVDFLPGAVVPAWLGVVETGHTSSRATFAVNVYPSSLTPGTYSTTLRFATGRVDSQGNVSEIRTRDVPLTLIVAQLNLSPSTLSLETPLGSNKNLTGTLSLQIPNGRAWTAADPQPWLTVRPSGTGPGLIDYTINSSGLALGSHTATVTVTDPDQVTDTTAITVTVRVPRLTANPAAPVLTVNTDNASTTQTLRIT